MIPDEILATLDQLDDFIDREIKSLKREDDNVRFFDHRREWEALLREMRRRADAARRSSELSDRVDNARFRHARAVR